MTDDKREDPVVTRLRAQGPVADVCRHDDGGAPVHNSVYEYTMAAPGLLSLVVESYGEMVNIIVPTFRVLWLADVVTNITGAAADARVRLEDASFMEVALDTATVSGSGDMIGFQGIYLGMWRRLAVGMASITSVVSGRDQPSLQPVTINRDAAPFHQLWPELRHNQ